MLQRPISLLLLIVLTISACKKFNRPESLPEITQTGQHTFGCLIDGKVFKTKIPFNAPVQIRATYFSRETPELRIKAPKTDDPNAETISITFNGVQLKEGATYKIGANNPGNVTASYLKIVNSIPIEYIAVSSPQGTIHISKLTSEIIAGTFSFDVYSEDKKFELRDGRFDLLIY